MKKLLILLFILTTFLFLTACDKDTPTDESSSETSKTEETTTVEDTTTVDETSTEIVEETTTDAASEDDSSTLASNAHLTRTDKVRFNFAQESSVIIKTNSNGYDYVAYGYNDATYIVSIDYIDGEANQSSIIKEVESVLRYYSYNFYTEPNSDDDRQYLSAPILEKEDGRLTLYFCCFADYSTVQEKLLDELSEIESVSKITVKNLVFSHSEVVKSYEYQRFKTTLSTAASCKGEIYTNYSDFQKSNLSFGITEDEFKDNYIILRGVTNGSAEQPDIYYYNAVCENGTAYLTYIENGIGISTGERVYYVDVIKVPKSLFKNASQLTSETKLETIKLVVNLESINDWAFANPGIVMGWIEK